MRDDPEDPERVDISLLEEMKCRESILIVIGFALFVLCLQSNVAPQSVQRILKSSRVRLCLL